MSVGGEVRVLLEQHVERVADGELGEDLGRVVAGRALPVAAGEAEDEVASS